MVWFHSIPIFKLEVYNKKLGAYLRKTPDGMHYGYECGFEAFFEQLPTERKHQVELFGKSIWEPQKGWLEKATKATRRDDHVIGKIEGAKKLIEFCLENKLINLNWLEYLEWYADNRKKILRASKIFKKFILGVPFLYRGIPPEAYKDLLKYGNTTTKFGDSDWMYAADNLPRAWERCREINKNPYIIVVYRKKYFYNDIRSNSYVWVRKDKSTDFRDTIVAIIRVRFF